MEQSQTSVPGALRNVERLTDSFGRHIHYLRLSVTDRCDLRCVYCMEPHTRFVPRRHLLKLEELAFVGRAFTELGVHTIRVTGGEPLVRHNVLQLFAALGCLSGLRELLITTNGTQLPGMAHALKSVGVRGVNISLDSLQESRFRQMTRNGDLRKVLAGIDAALVAGFERVKLNAVILKNRNHDEVLPLVRFAAERGCDISFIEEMPLGVNHDHERLSCYYSSDDIRRDIARHYYLSPSRHTTSGPSRYYHLHGTKIRVGFISPHSHNFCGQCNRVRVTCEGRLLLCLGQEHSVDLRRILRQSPGDAERLKEVIRKSMTVKPKGHDFTLTGQPVIFRHMNATGG